MEKNEAQISGFVVAKKALEKKFLPAYLCGYDLQNSVRIFFQTNASRDI